MEKKNPKKQQIKFRIWIWTKPGEFVCNKSRFNLKGTLKETLVQPGFTGHLIPESWIPDSKTSVPFSARRTSNYTEVHQEIKGLKCGTE